MSASLRISRERDWQLPANPSHGCLAPKPVIGRLLSHSRKQTFAVLPHRQDCALVGRSTEIRLSSKADVNLATVTDRHGPTPDVWARLAKVQLGPNRKWPASFDYLIGPSEEHRRHVDAERLGGLEVDYQLELGRLLNRQIGRS
jgi:hypothetical protein